MLEQQEEIQMAAIREGVFTGAEMVFDSNYVDLAFWLNNEMEFVIIDLMTHSVLLDFSFDEFSNLKNILMSIDIKASESDEEVLYNEGLYTIIICLTNGEVLIKWHLKDRHRCLLTFKQSEWYEFVEGLKSIGILGGGNTSRKD